LVGPGKTRNCNLTVYERRTLPGNSGKSGGRDRARSSNSETARNAGGTHLLICPSGGPRMRRPLSTKIVVDQALREKAKLFSEFNKSTRRANHPKSPSSPSDKNILIFRSCKSSYIDRIPFHSEGRFANVTNVGMGCGGRGGA
jgi:hypothetical protein